MARCGDGGNVSEEAVTRAVGQVRRLSRQVPGAFALETIAEVGYRLLPAAVAAPVRALPARTFEPRPPAVRWRGPAGLLVAAGVVLVAGRVLLPLVETSGPAPVEPSAQLRDLGTTNAEARDRHRRAVALLDAGDRANTLRAVQLLLEALELDPEFQAAKESLAVALQAAAAFEPARAGAELDENPAAR
jgi:hypothetical protein